MKKLIYLSSFIILFTASVYAQSTKADVDNSIYLLVRGDDIGFSHAANVGCIDSYKEGIMQSVEIMPVTPWFLEAVEMLNENPGLDVGIHLALTSEWSYLKWRPLTDVPSLVDSNGYFYPMVWQQKHYAPNTSIQMAKWDIVDVEKELRAQIELALKHVPHITHMGGHMGFANLDPRLSELMKQLAEEYGLDVDLPAYDFKRFSGWDKETPYEERIDKFCENVNALTPGYYIFVDHPALNVPEMQAVSHPGYENVAIDREWVTRVFTSEKL